MAFIDDIGATVTSAAQNAVKKGQDITSIAKLKLRISEDEKRINEIYAHIGRIYVRKFGDRTTGEAGRLIDEIRETEERLAEYKRQISEIKGTSVCPVCNAELQRGSAYCNVCGKKQIEDEALTEEI